MKYSTNSRVATELLKITDVIDKYIYRMSYKESYDWFIDIASSKDIDGDNFVFDFKMYNNLKELGIDCMSKIQYLLNHTDIQWVEYPGFNDNLGEPRSVRDYKLILDKFPSHRINTTLYLYSINLTPRIYEPITDDSYLKLCDGLYVIATPVLCDLKTCNMYREFRCKLDVGINIDTSVELQTKILDVFRNIDQYTGNPKFGIIARFLVVDKN